MPSPPSTPCGVRTAAGISVSCFATSAPSDVAFFWSSSCSRRPNAIETVDRIQHESQRLRASMRPNLHVDILSLGTAAEPIMVLLRIKPSHADLVQSANGNQHHLSRSGRLKLAKRPGTCGGAGAERPGQGSEILHARYRAGARICADPGGTRVRGSGRGSYQRSKTCVRTGH